MDQLSNKTRLVVKISSQQYGVDYEDNFSSMTKMTIIRTFIAVAFVR